ncbi:MAG TPA: hypothetical protein DCE71_02165 [Parachlamydiales bacterium]|nr:hypothetical protein [Parachlamydiales bacterium]
MSGDLNVKGLKESLTTLLVASSQGKAAAKQQSAESGSTSSQGSSLGSKYLERNLKSSPTLDDTTTSASLDPTTDDNTGAYYASIMDQLFALMAEVSANLSDSMNSSLEVSVAGSQQANFGAEAAKVSSDNFQAQQAEQAKKQKHMRILNRCMKGLAITILVVSVATGQPELAPISTLLMTSLSALMIAKPELITNQLITPLTSVLTNQLGMPEKWANLLASAIVITAIVASTAGAGFLADSSQGLALGEKVTQKVGREAAQNTLKDGGLDYIKLGVGNAGVANAQMLAAAHPYVELLSGAFPNNPIIGQVLGIMLTLTIVLGSGVAGGTLVGSSGYFNSAALTGTFAEFENLTITNEDLLKLLPQVLRLAQAGAEGDQAWVGFQIGKTQLGSAQAQAQLTQAKGVTQGANNYVRGASEIISQISSSLGSLIYALNGIAAGGEELARLNR